MTKHPSPFALLSKKALPLDALHTTKSYALLEQQAARLQLRAATTPIRLAQANAALDDATELLEHMRDDPEFWLEYFAKNPMEARTFDFEIYAAGLGRSLCLIPDKLKHHFSPQHRPKEPKGLQL